VSANERPCAARAADGELAADRVEAVGEAAQARPGRRARAADAVVGDLGSDRAPRD
jgi:hypothetical protein